MGNYETFKYHSESSSSSSSSSSAMATLHCDASRRCRRYDPSMSRRTRKPVKITQQQEEEEMAKDADKGLLMFQSSVPVLQESIVGDSSRLEGKKAGEDLDRRHGGHFEEEEKTTAGMMDDDGEPEKKLALVVAKKGGGGGGVNIVGMVGRCMKTLNSLITARRHQSKIKNIARLS